MARALLRDMRQRVIDRVESGASQREAAEHYEVSPSTAVIWVKCFRGIVLTTDHASSVPDVARPKAMATIIDRVF